MPRKRNARCLPPIFVSRSAQQKVHALSFPYNCLILDLLIWCLSRNSTEALNVPCAPELTSLLSCFATTGDLRHATSCADSAKALHTCMAQGKGKGGKSGSSVSSISTIRCSCRPWAAGGCREMGGKPNGTMLILYTCEFGFHRSTIFWARSEDRRTDGWGNERRR